MNGFMLQGTTTDEVHEIMNDAVDELRLVVVDKKTQTIYKSNKVAVNLKNVEGNLLLLVLFLTGSLNYITYFVW